MSEFWAENAGIAATPDEVARASAANAEARARMDVSSLSAAEVADRLGLPLPTLQHYAGDRKLYSYRLDDGELVFPTWQFNDAATKTIPSLAEVLSALPSNLHPQSVAGFFLTPHPDLVINGHPVGAKAWLEAGRNKEPVLALAGDLAAGY